jgi:uncharacterized protein (TIGR03437 family)
MLSTTVCPECGAVPRVPLAVSIASGNNQTGNAGAPLASPIVVEVLDQIAGPLAGMTVQFSAFNATVAPASATTDSQGRAAATVTLGNAAGTATVTATVQGLQPAMVRATVQRAPLVVQAAGIVNAASMRDGPVAPGEIVTVFLSGMTGPAELAGLRLNSAGLVDTTLAETRVLFDGFPAPLVYTAQNQISAVAPYPIGGRAQTQVAVEYRGDRSNVVFVPVAPTAPALFTVNSSGSGPAAALNEDGTLNTVSSRARKGSLVVFYATGEGETTPAGIDGKPAGEPLPRPQAAISLNVGGTPAEILYAGGAPGLVAGVMQINARLNPNTPSGPAVEVFLRAGTAASREGVTVAVE